MESTWWSRLFGGHAPDALPEDSKALLAPYLTLIEAAEVPCVGMRAGEGDAERGRSRFGGSPDVPAGFRWPENPGGRPLDFLAQIDVEEVLAAAPLLAPDLPSRGVFHFFYDAQEQPWGTVEGDTDYWRLFFTADPKRLTETAAGPGYPTSGRRIEFRLQKSLPEDVLFDLPEAAQDAYQESSHSKGPSHQFLGYPVPVQSDMTEPGTPDNPHGARRLLFQLDSDEALGTMWGDLGTLYVLVDREALARGELKDPWVVMQCS